MKKILFAGSEVMPFSATGGLGDVLGSLPSALAENCDNDIRVVMPLYSAIDSKWRAAMKDECNFRISLAWRNQYCGVKSIRMNGVIYYFIDNEYYFFRDRLYGNYDDGEIYAFFSMAVAELMWHIEFFPDILHANDWQTALSIVYLNVKYRSHIGYGNIRTVFTIHNIEYQGQFDPDILGDVFALGEDCRGLMDWNGKINLMKAAIVSADAVCTVSQRYAWEIQSPAYGRGLEDILTQYSFKLHGILNGIDYNCYNPMTDKTLTQNYSAATAYKKSINKLAIQKLYSMNENEDVALLAVISRLVGHKGLDLLCEIAHSLVSQKHVQLIVLGTGEEKYENFFRGLEYQFPSEVRAVIDYDRELARKIYAAADIFIMPSRSEPCGLAQMIASRYGAIPVVRETGGLYDSIKGYWEDNGMIRGNGFTFANYSPSELYDRICAALDLWNDREKRRQFVKIIMEMDFSWKKSALKYESLYDDIIFHR